MPRLACHCQGASDVRADPRGSATLVSPSTGYPAGGSKPFATHATAVKKQRRPSVCEVEEEPAGIGLFIPVLARGFSAVAGAATFRRRFSSPDTGNKSTESTDAEPCFSGILRRTLASVAGGRRAGGNCGEAASRLSLARRRRTGRRSNSRSMISPRQSDWSGS